MASHLNGISPDSTLLWGVGTHNGNTEGWVATLPAGWLADYAEPALPAAIGQDVACAWVQGVASTTKVSVFVFFKNGYYVQIADTPPPSGATGASGFERGRYT